MDMESNYHELYPFPLKTSRVEEIMHINYVEAQIPPVGGVWKFGEGVRAVCDPRYLSMSLNLDVRHQRALCRFSVLL
ncbi:hypothetical protein TNCV_402221 [Trichonephila clavipes]|nr:hypothetical protein TNCV_402221 [Trichonephila clavipes]